MLSGAEEEVGKVWTVERDRQIDRKKRESGMESGGRERERPNGMVTTAVYMDE